MKITKISEGVFEHEKLSGTKIIAPYLHLKSMNNDIYFIGLNGEIYDIATISKIEYNGIIYNTAVELYSAMIDDGYTAFFHSNSESQNVQISNFPDFYPLDKDSMITFLELEKEFNQKWVARAVQFTGNAINYIDSSITKAKFFKNIRIYEHGSGILNYETDGSTPNTSTSPSVTGNLYAEFDYGYLPKFVFKGNSTSSRYTISWLEQ